MKSRAAAWAATFGGFGTIDESGLPQLDDEVRHVRKPRLGGYAGARRLSIP